MEDIVQHVLKALKTEGDEKIRKSSQRFFKEPIPSYGIKAASVTRIGKKYFPHSSTKAEIFTFCEALWQSGYLEATFIACNWSYALRKQYVVEDFSVFERWINQYVNNWASCDTLCNHTVGAVIEMYPEKISRLKFLATSGNRWMRRASAVSLIVPARKGKFLNDIFAIADLLLNDPDDIVQKGYGWMLKVASQRHESEIFSYVMKNKNAMPRTALRYAIEKMPDALRRAAMTKNQSID